VVVPCGFCLEIPPGYCGLVLPRSGLAAKFGITCLNAPGLIDAGYRGEIKVILINHDPKNTFIVEKYDRIAQLVIVPVANVYLNEVEYLNESERGDQGFGHSGFRN
jgi:dUTP pyrophosphatase